jgi:hypothetical protein
MIFAVSLKLFMLKNIFTSLMLLLSGLLYGQGQTPALNQKIIDYVNTQIGKKIDRGECWDLAYEALTRNNCEWDGKYAYGKKLNPKTDSIYPGDLLQFEDVTIKYQENNVIYKELYPHHTAIIYKVIAKGDYKIAHQNFGNIGRKVGITELKLSGKLSGSIYFYRPVAKTE